MKDNYKKRREDPFSNSKLMRTNNFYVFFFFVILSTGLSSYSQTPGGVATGLKIWLKADAETAADNSTTLTTWTNRAPSETYSVTQGTPSRVPVYYNTTANKLINFNASFYFNGTNSQFLNATRIIPATSAYSFIAVALDEGSGAGNYSCIINTNNVGANSSFSIHKYPTGNSNGWLSWRYAARYLVNGSVNNPSLIGGNGFSSGATANTNHGYWNGTSYTQGINGVTNIARAQIVALTSLNGAGTPAINSYIDGYKSIGTGNPQINSFDAFSVGDYAVGTPFPFRGAIPEVLGYSRQLDDTEMLRVNSYLAIKYGITLGAGGSLNNLNKNGTNSDYVDSNGTVIWNGLANTTYGFNITGIGRDDASALNQKQSKSYNAPSLVTVGKSTIATANQLNTGSFLADRDFLIFGDNNAAINSFSITGAPFNRQIISRKWLVSEVGTDATDYTISVPANSSSLTTKLPLDTRGISIIVDADGDFSSGSIEIPMALVGTNWVANNIDLDNNFYFTFATKLSVLAQIGNEADNISENSVTTVAELSTISPVITGLIAANQSAYQAYIDANPNLFSSPATAAEVQAMVNAVNASQSVLVQIGNEGDAPDTVNSVVTVAQMQTIVPAITGLVAANESAYQDYIDANPNLFSSPATVAEVQAMVNAVNASQSVLAQIGNEGDAPDTVNSVVTVAQLQTISPAITGLVAGNQTAYQDYIDANPNLFSSPATQAEVQAMVNAVNASQSVLVQIGNEGDAPDTVNSVVTVAQMQTISPAITGLVAGNESAYQDYIDANPNLFSSPATAAEVQAMVNAVNGASSVLVQIGNEGDSPNVVTSVVTVAQINTIVPAITGAILANESAYQAYIDANPNLFSSPATAAEVQAMVNAVNASQSVLAQIGNEGDAPDTVNSVVTVAQMQTISPAITGLVAGNQTAYQDYIDANPGLFSSPATVAEVQAMVNAVNASQSVLAQIGNEGDAPDTVNSVVTVAQLQTISPAITGLVAGNQTAYQDYIDANPGLFSSPATVAEVQAMVNAVNASQSVLAQIGNEGDAPNVVTSVVTVAQINTISPAITGAILANQSAYQAYIDANPNLFSSPATAAEVQAMVNAVNASQSVLVQIGNEGDAPDTVNSVVTVAQMQTISPTITGLVVANESAYQDYIDANPNLFSSPATVAEVQAMVNAVNASQSVLAQIGNEGDAPDTVNSVVTVAQLQTISPAITGLVAGNQTAYQDYIDANPGLFSSPATVAEVQAMVNAVNASQSVLAQIGNEGDAPDTVNSVVTVAQLQTISPAITGLVAGNQTAYQDYIDANPGLFSSPATVAEVQAMVNAVNGASSVLVQIGNEGDSPNVVTSVVTVAQINTIVPAITGAIVANQSAYQAYIDANPNLFSSPATAAEVQAMVNAVNASQSVLAQIGNEGDAPDTVNSVVTVAQLQTISPTITGLVVANESAYQDYIDANPGLFSSPATVAEVQAMVNAVNASQSVLAQIGNEGDAPDTVNSVVTVAQMQTISPAITGLVAGNQTVYQDYIDANPNLFSSPATAAEVQAMVNAVNASQSVLAQIGNEGDAPNVVTSVVTVAQINTIVPAITGAILANESAYQAYIDANPNLFSSPATAAEVQAMVNAVNGASSVLVQIGNEGDSPNVVTSVVTVAQMQTIVPAITGLVAGNQTAYQDYIDANPNLFSSPATVAEVQAMVNAVNASQSVLAQIGNEGDAPDTVNSVVTVAQLQTISPAITGLVAGNQTAYQDYIDANPGLFSSPATVAEVQAMVNAVNASQSVLAQIGNEGDAPDTVNSVVTVAQMQTISPAITGLVAGNESAYQDYIDANPNLFSSPATAAEVQAMVNAVNGASSVLVQIGNEGDSPNVVTSVVTVAQMQTIVPAITGLVAGNQTAYQDYIDANPNLFSSPATVAEVQAMVNAVNASQSVLAQIGNEGDAPDTVNSVVTVAQLQTISPAITGLVAGNQTAYQDYIDANPNLFSSPATAAEVQAMVNAVNASQSVLAQIGNEGDAPNVVPSVVTVAQINTISPAITGAILANESAYQAYIDANPNLFSSPATAAEVQAMVNAVNASQSVLAQIGTEADVANILSIVTVAQMQTISPAITGLVAANQSAYQAYIDANPNLFSSPATQAEVQAMVNAVNASQSVLAQIGNEGDAPDTVNSVVTVAQMQTISPAITGLVAGNQTAYQDYIDANPGLFSSPATAAEVQAMVNAVNASQSVLAQIGNEGDAPDTVNSVVTVAQMQTISPAITGLVAGNQTAYQDYIDANPNLFSSPATVAEVQAMVNAVNASQSVLAQIGTEADAANILSIVTVAQINTISPAITGAILANQSAYQAYIDANPNLFSSPATQAEVQVMVNAVNASQSVLAQIGNEGDAPDTVNSVVTVAQMQTISPAITGLVAANESAYQDYIDANPNLFSSPATAAEVQAMVNAVNASQSVLAQIGNEGDAPNVVTSVVTVAQINTISPAITGAIVANQSAYQAYIDANPNLFSSPATAAEVQAMVNAVNASQSVLAQIGIEADASNISSVVTVAQINTISPVIIGAIVTNESAYQAYIDANPNLFSSPATAAEVQAMINIVNALSNDSFDYENNIMVYPNPASNYFIVKLNFDVENSEINVFDINGRIVHKQSIGSGETQISIDNLQDGIYLLNIIIDNKVFYKKIVKK